jgi:hypothetical protein
MTVDQRWFSSLTLVMTKEYIPFRDNGRGRVLSVGTVNVSEPVMTLRRISLIKSLGYNPLSFFRLLMTVLKSISKRVVLVFWTLELIFCARSSPRVRLSEPIYLGVLAILMAWLLEFQQSFGNGIGD